MATPSIGEIISYEMKAERTINEIIDGWTGPAGRTMMRNVTDRVKLALGEAQEAEEKQVLRALMEKLNTNLQNASYLLREIGGELAGIDSEIRNPSARRR